MEPETLIGRCPEGQKFVRVYRKRNGEYVKGFCRKRHERITRHDREVDRRNAEIARRSLQPEESVEEPSNKEVKEEEKELQKELKEEHKEGSTESTIRAAEERAQ